MSLPEYTLSLYYMSARDRRAGKARDSFRPTNEKQLFRVCQF